MSTEGYAAPTTELEARLAGIWAAAFELQRVGVHDDFFGLGGHSLLATRLVARIATQLDLEVSTTAIYRYPTIHQLAQLLARLRLSSTAAAGAPEDTFVEGFV
jgi:acyl carrier protein